MMNNLSSIIGASNLAVQGVTYAADIFGFLAGGDAAGSQLMANLTTRVSHTRELSPQARKCGD